MEKNEKDRIRRRLDEMQEGAGGSAFPINHMVSRGMDINDAEEAAKNVHQTLQEAVDKSEVDSQAEEEEIPPPDTAVADDGEKKAAKRLADLLRTSSDRLAEDTDPLLNPTLRENIERSLKPIDVHMLLFNGYADQEILLFGGEAKLCLRSLKTRHYSALDRWVWGNDVTRDLPWDQKMRVRLWAATALTIQEFAGQIPGDLQFEDSDFMSGELNKHMGEVLKVRLEWLLNQSPPVVQLLCMNVTWFEQRMRRLISSAAYVGDQIKKS